MKNNIYLLFFFLCLHSLANTQYVLDFEAYKKRVLTFHPISIQANAIKMIGLREIQQAKGSLDPVVFSDLAGKEFEGKDYYFLSNSGLKIPTWIGLDVKTGYEANRGTYLNSQMSTPNSGLWYAGVEVPLGRGLFFDERRAAIQQAKIAAALSENEQKLMLNDLLLDAYEAYWNWYENYQRFQIAEEGYRFASIRFQGVRQNALLGDVPYIDTLEANIQLQDRNMDLIQARFNFFNAGLILETFLWSDDLIPLELDSLTIPGNFTFEAVQLNLLRLSNLNAKESNNPFLLESIYKVEQLKVEEKLKREMLKPTFDVQYNALVRPYGDNQLTAINPQNYKWGANVYYPLFIRKERAGLKITKLKIEANEAGIELKIIDLKNKEEAIRNEIYRSSEMISIQQNQVQNSRRLRDAEQIRFELGESSLFLVNSREMSYLSSRIKLAEYESKLKISEAKWKWIAGELVNE
jgi:outer membrane protein TolC